ncbi:biotin transporter BioY [Paenibacillus sp. L3-i20]|uniref:biotin transporter BioY n=1 Tax=Paenibacillus sp. L3-i20 TaxID=2905833 RepID=UPI001EE03151|nr:biotin transporter BioY [Paenibacillus sp. L3-i20]GKU78713.1 biotin transporter BioY [Paenibacillus sp. L3-i20]
MQSNSIRSMVYVALFAALFIVLSIQQMRFNISVIPITLQTFGIILAGLFLKPRLAFMSLALVILLAFFGLPLFGGKGGISHLIGPTGGFIIAFPFCAMFTSMAIEKLLSSKWIISKKVLTTIILFAIFMLLSSMLSYLPGLLWFKNVASSYTWTKIYTMGVSFLPGDAIKSSVGALVAVSMLSFVYRFRKGSEVKGKQL